MRGPHCHRTHPSPRPQHERRTQRPPTGHAQAVWVPLKMEVRSLAPHDRTAGQRGWRALSPGVEPLYIGPRILDEPSAPLWARFISPAGHEGDPLGQVETCHRRRPLNRRCNGETYRPCDTRRRASSARPRRCGALLDIRWGTRSACRPRLRSRRSGSSPPCGFAAARCR